MVRCWKHSEAGLEDPRSMVRVHVVILLFPLAENMLHSGTFPLCKRIYSVKYIYIYILLV